jgi:hypothetical protein
MKKILFSTIALTAFSLSIIFFQMSCKKEANAQESANEQSSFILYKTYYSEALPNGDIIDERQFWLADIDGGNQKKIPINLPNNLIISRRGEGRLTNDGKTLIFVVEDQTHGRNRIAMYIYSCSLDGSNLKKVIDYTKDMTGRNGGGDIYLEDLD